MVTRSLWFLATTAVLAAPLAHADLGRPLPPVTLTSMATQEGIVLTWLPPPVSPVPVMGFNIYRIDSEETVLVDTVPADQTSYVDTSVGGEYVYTYFLTSQAAQTESAPSNPSFAGYPNCPDLTDWDCLYPLPPDGPALDPFVLALLRP